MQTIKTGHCRSLSGRTMLTYHIGWLKEEVYLHLHENSSGGLFSKEWVSLERLGLQEGEPISSSTLQSKFGGKSANTGGFIGAVLLSEGLIKPVEGKSRNYICCDPTAYKEVMRRKIP